MTSDRVPYTQTGRMITVSSRLGEDVLLLDRLDIWESINDLFEMHASVRSKRSDLQAADLIGSNVDFSLKLKNEERRYWNGLVTNLHEGPLISRNLRSYELTVRPALWLLSQKTDCRIFQNQTSLQIMQTLCSEHGINALDLRITGQLAPQPYSVQWNESDLNYMLRRMQIDGLFYWFEHREGVHTFVVADHQFGYRDCGEPQVRYTQGSSDRDHITDWRRTFSFIPGKRSGRDWNFELMSAPFGQQPSLVALPGNGTRELYEFPGGFLDTSAAREMMKHRMEATETAFETVEARSNVRFLAPGQRFTPYVVENTDQAFGQQVVTAIRHKIISETYEAATNETKAPGRPEYENTFTVMPSQTPATPHRTVPRPRIVGSQIALIAGPQGEEIFTDQFGRVKLTFPWDRRAKADGSDTCWMRVGQAWAGTTWGSQVIPRVGMEAVVSYQEGDPDRPFVIAVVPDPINSVPYALPENKTRMVLRSNSYKSNGYNEMTFEDRAGAENVFFHAQKDHTTKIENNQTNSVGANHSNVVGHNQALTVGNNQTLEIGGSANLTVGATGARATALMEPLLSMAGETAGLLGEALSTAGSTSTGIISIIQQLASSTIGIMSPAGQSAQQNVWNGPNARIDAGTALASAGNILGEAGQRLFSMPGMMNTIVGTMRTDSIGVAHAMQIGTCQVVNVGKTKFENIGEFLKITVGLSTLTMDALGNVTISGSNLLCDFAETITLNAGGAISFNAGGAIALDAGGAIALDAGGVITLNSAGATTIDTAGPLVLIGNPLTPIP